MTDIYDPDNPINAPDAHYGIREWQDINQRNSQHGLPAVHSDEWGSINAMADAIVALDGVEFPLDSNWIAQRMAADMVRHHMERWNALGERTVDTRYCADHDDSQVQTMSRLYVLTYTDTAAFPLNDPAQYQRAAEELLRSGTHCAPAISDNCDSIPSRFVAVRRGDHLCLFKLCRPCRKAIGIIETEDDPDYIGPKEWVDDRDGTPRLDPFELPMKSPWSKQISEYQPDQPVSDDDPWSS